MFYINGFIQPRNYQTRTPRRLFYKLPASSEISRDVGWSLEGINRDRVKLYKKVFISRWLSVIYKICETSYVSLTETCIVSYYRTTTIQEYRN